MSLYRATRFLIDKVDNKLGNVDKEIKFDKTMIYSCLGVIAFEIILLALSGISRFFLILSIIGAFLATLSLFTIPVMVKELKDDQEKAKRIKQQETTSV